MDGPAPHRCRCTWEDCLNRETAGVLVMWCGVRRALISDCDDELVLPCATGGPLRLNNRRPRVFRPACVKADIEDFRVYHLQHTAASL